MAWILSLLQLHESEGWPNNFPVPPPQLLMEQLWCESWIQSTLHLQWNLLWRDLCNERPTFDKTPLNRNITLNFNTFAALMKDHLSYKSIFVGPWGGLTSHVSLYMYHYFCDIRLYFKVTYVTVHLAIMRSTHTLIPNNIAPIMAIHTKIVIRTMDHTMHSQMAFCEPVLLNKVTYKKS